MRVNCTLWFVVFLVAHITAYSIDQRGDQIQSIKVEWGQPYAEHVARRSKRSLGVLTECPAADEKQQILQRMKTSAADPSLVDYGKMFDSPTILQPVPGVFFMIGWGLSNSIVLDAPDGLIVINTLDSVKAAKPAVAALRNLTKKPVAAIIYTHNHADHISGTSAFVAGQDSGSYEIWGYSNIMTEFWRKWLNNRPLMMARGFRQVGVPLVPIGPNAIINGGLGPRFIADQTTGLMLNPPTKFLDTEEMAVKIAGLGLNLIHVPGTTKDQMVVLLPDFNGKRILASADVYYNSFPNLYGIRGVPPRSALSWADSVRLIRDLKVEVLLPSHTIPVVGADVIYERLTKNMDAVQFVHDQTIRLMNHGRHPDEIAKQVVLPPSLQEEYLVEHTCHIEWAVKTVFDGQMGWFSGYPEELRPLTLVERGNAMVGAFGAQLVISKGKEALDLGKYQTALEFASYVWHSDRGNADARKLRQDALIGLAEGETSAEGRNYYMTWLLEETCLFDNRPSGANDLATLKLVSIDDVFTKLKVMLIAERVEGVELCVTVRVTDLEPQELWHLEIRNSILEVSSVHVSDICTTCDVPSNATTVDPAAAACDEPVMCMDNDNLRRYLIGEEPLDQLTIGLSRWSSSDLETFRSYFESVYYLDV